MNQKTTVVLLVALLLAFGFFVCYQRGWLGLGPAETPKTRVGEKVLETGPSTTAVRKVELTQPDKPRIVAEYNDQDHKWRLTEPIQALADAVRVTELITTFKDLTVAAVYPPDTRETPRPDVTGLDNPRAVLLLTDEGGKSYRLDVGNSDPLSPDKTYVTVSGDKRIYSVGRDPMDKLGVQAGQLREKDIWTFSKDKIQKIAFTSQEKEGSIVLEKNAADRWGIIQPVRAPADETKVSDLLGKVINLKVNDWAADASARPALYGLTPPRLTIDIHYESKPAQPATTQPTTKAAEPAEYADARIAFGAEAKDLTYAQLAGDNAVFTVKAYAAKELAAKLDELRETKLAPFSKSDAAHISLTDAAGRVTTLIRDVKNDWQITGQAVGAEKPIAADNQAVENWLDKLSSLKADSFEDESTVIGQTAMSKLQFAVAVNVGKDKPEVTLAIGQPTATGAMVYARGGDCPSLALVRSGELKEIAVEPISLADRMIWSLPEDRIVRFTRTGKGGDRSIERGADDGWRLIAPVKMDAESDATKNLLSKFKELKAVKRTMLSASDVGLDQPIVRLTVTVRQPAPPTTQPAATESAAPEREEPYVLSLAKKGDKLYGQLNATPGDKAGLIYELDAGLLDEATGEWAARKLLGLALDATKAVSVTIISPPPVGPAELTRADETWTLKRDPALPIDKAKVEELVKNLADVSVIRYIDFDAKDLGKYGLDKPNVVVTVTFDGGEVKAVTLNVSAKGESDGFYAAAPDSSRVGLISASELLKVQKDWSFFEKK